MLETFPPRSRLACCGTCERWYLRHNRAFCPALRNYLPDNLTTCGCAVWRQEPRETFAVELYQELVQEGAK